MFSIFFPLTFLLSGFSTRKRRSNFREAISELEKVCLSMAADEDLLDRAERRDLPTAHQELRWRPVSNSDSNSHDTSGNLTIKKMQNQR